MENWTAPQILMPEGIETDRKQNKGENSWDSFHKKVREKCGAYLRSKGDINMREIIESSSRRGLELRRSKEVRNFFKKLEEERKNGN